MKIRLVGADLFHTDGHTDGQKDMKNVTVAFRNIVDSPKKNFPLFNKHFVSAT